MKKLTRYLKNKLQEPLPATVAHKKLAPFYRNVEAPSKQTIQNAKKASVLILLYEKDKNIYFPLIERATYKGVHSGQIALPGGKKENDESFLKTALREAEEEIGVEATKIEILGKLTNVYISPSNFYVYPYVGVYKGENINFTPQISEVAQIIELKLQYLLQEKAIQNIDITKNETIFTVPAFVFEECTIWGATAIILSELVEVLKPFEK